MFHLKEKQTIFCIITRRMTTKKGARSVGKLRQGAGKPFFPKMFTNPGLLLTNVTVDDTPNLTHHFQIGRHFGSRNSTIGGLYRRAT